MCGIFGASRLTPSTRAMLPYLGIEMANRGTDSWGASNGSEVIRKLGSIVDTFECPSEWDQAIFHTRAASHGAKTIENAHPFVFKKLDGSEVIGIHNGIIRSHNELNQKFSRNFEVDSMHIYANFAEGRGVESIEGYGALAWYEDGELNFCRFGTYDLHAVTLEGGELLFCSLAMPLERITKMLRNPIKTRWQTDEFIQYRLDQTGPRDILTRVGEMDFSEAKKKIQLHPSGGGGTTYSSRTVWNPGTSTSRGATNSGYWMDMEVCYVCRAVKIETSKSLVCKSCLGLCWEEFQQKSVSFPGVN